MTVIVIVLPHDYNNLVLYVTNSEQHKVMTVRRWKKPCIDNDARACVLL